jgi:hypothetical protein
MRAVSVAASLRTGYLPITTPEKQHCLSQFVLIRTKTIIKLQPTSNYCVVSIITDTAR